MNNWLAMQFTRRMYPSAHPHATPGSGNGRPRFAFVGKIVISVCLLVYVLSQAKLAAVLGAMSNADARWLAIALCQPALGIYLTALRWNGLLRAQGVHIPVRHLAQSCSVAGFFRQFLPSTIGGDAVRIIDTARWGAPLSIAGTSVVVDRIVGLAALACISAFAIVNPNLLTTTHPQLKLIVVAFAVGALFLLWLLFFPWLHVSQGEADNTLPTFIRSFGRKVSRASTAYHGKTNALTRAVSVSVLFQLNVITFYFVISRVLHLKLPYTDFLLIVPVAVLVMMVPISVNGIGLREGVFVTLLAVYGVNKEVAVAFAWLEYGVFLCWGLIGGIVYATRGRAAAAQIAKARSVLSEQKSLKNS